MNDCIPLAMKRATRWVKRQCFREIYRCRLLTNGDRWYTSHEWSFYYSDGFTETVTRRDFV